MLVPLYTLSGAQGSFVVKYEDLGDPEKQKAIESEWNRFKRVDPATGQSFDIWSRPTDHNLQVCVERRMPAGAQPGRYRVEVFVPSAHASTRRAIFTVLHSFRWRGGRERFEEEVAVIDMFDQQDAWRPLGEFTLDPEKNPLSGAVRQFDLSMEEPAEEIAFGPVRWIPLFTAEPDCPTFDAPVGTAQERARSFGADGLTYGRYPLWTGKWFDFNPYLSWYSLGYHTGADLNLPGSSDADKGQPIYAIGDGLVTFAGPAGSWGHIVVVEHPDALVTLPNGTVLRQAVHSRYGHVEPEIPVQVGQMVRRGERVASVGLPAGQITGWHLHFDICHSGLLKSRPTHWPNLARVRELQSAKVNPAAPRYRNAQLAIKMEVIRHYLDPYQFIKDNHASGPAGHDSQGRSRP